MRPSTERSQTRPGPFPGRGTDLGPQLTGWSAQPGWNVSQLAPAKTKQCAVFCQQGLNRWKRGMQVARTSGLATNLLVEVSPAPRRVGRGLFQKVEKIDSPYPRDQSQMCFQDRLFATWLMTASDTLNLRASTARGIPADLAARILLIF